jgi:hypothetical protein
MAGQLSKPTSAAALSIERRLFFVATITGTSSATAFRFRGGRL